MNKTDLEIITYLANRDSCGLPGATYSDLKNYMGVTSNQTVADRISRLANGNHVVILKGKAGIKAAYKPKKWVLASCGHLVESTL